MDSLLTDVIQKVEPVCPPGKRALCAVSGGADSVMLLRALHAAGYKKLVVCHFNHCARGRESDADERFVARLAARLGFEFEAGRSAAGAEGSEAVWREERYRFFAQAARRRRTRVLFLGHNADDQAETVLWNLLRGCGRRGLAGMRPVSERDGLVLVRPFLEVPRAVIEREARRAGVRFRTDSSNADTRFSRNTLRHLVIPEIERLLGRNVREPLAAAARILAEEERFLDGLARRELERCGLAPGELDARKTASLPVALQRRALGLWLDSFSGVAAGFEHVEALRGILRPAPGDRGRMAAVNLPGNHRVRRRAGRLILERLELADCRARRALPRGEGQE